MRTPYDMSPSDALDAVILLAIDQHVGKPCPTRHTLCQWTGLPRRLVWKYVDSMCARGLLSVATMTIREDTQTARRRKITLTDGRTTDWTKPGPERRPPQVKDQNRGGAIAAGIVCR